MKSTLKCCMILILLTVSAISVFAQEVIAIVDHKTPVLIVDKVRLLETFNRNIKEIGKPAGYTEVFISPYEDKLVLSFKGVSGKASLALVTRGITENGVTMLMADGKTVCTSKACAHTSGCEPRILLYGCSACNGDCEKTSSSYSMLGDAYTYLPGYELYANP